MAGELGQIYAAIFVVWTHHPGHPACVSSKPYLLSSPLLGDYRITLSFSFCLPVSHSNYLPSQSLPLFSPLHHFLASSPLPIPPGTMDIHLFFHELFFPRFLISILATYIPCPCVHTSVPCTPRNLKPEKNLVFLYLFSPNSRELPPCLSPFAPSSFLSRYLTADIM